MSRPLRGLMWAGALYATAWVGYVAKSVAGLDLIPYDARVVGGHHGAWFPGSDAVVGLLRPRGR